MWMLFLVPWLGLQDSKPEQKLDVENTKYLLFDSSRGLTLKILNDGKVELSVREEPKEGAPRSMKTFSAPSAAEFRARYPELVKKYDLGRHLGGGRALSQDEFEKWWKALGKAPGLPVPGLGSPLDPEFRKNLEEELNRLKDLRRQFRFPGDDSAPPETPPGQSPVPGGRELGVKVQDVGDTLRDQLSLPEDEGVLVTEVKPGSVAERSGIKEHDILLKLEGSRISDRWQFRADILAALGKPAFDLEIVRGGKRETVRVKTSVHKKDE